MRKRLRTAKGSAKRVRRLRLPAIVIAVALLVIGAVTVLSRQMSTATEKPDSQGARSPLTNAPNKNYITVKVAGQDVQVDSETGQIKELTPEEIAKLASGLKQVINQSTDGLEQVQQSDGSVTMDLQGRFSNVTVARENGDGTFSESCVDNARAAGAFFGIDPNLIENQPSNREPGTHRPIITPAKPD